MPLLIFDSQSIQQLTGLTGSEGAGLVRQEISKKYGQHSRVSDAVLSAIPDFAYIFDREGRFLYANNALLNLWGLTLEAVVGKNFFDLKYPDDLAAKCEARIKRCDPPCLQLQTSQK
jgi:PAS domain-containing protein